MNKQFLIIIGIIIAIALGITSIYLQTGEEISSSISEIANPCLNLYDKFADELKKEGFFTSESTEEQNRSFQKFVTDGCLSNIDSWLPSDRQSERNFLDQLKQRMEP